MASETAEVVLRAHDEITVPVLKAVAAMEQLQAALRDVVSASKTTGEAANVGAQATKNLGAAAESSVVPHRAAHQALNLVSTQMAELAGTSQSAHGALRVFDSVLFQLAMTGGAVSLNFIAIVSIVTTLTSVFSALHESAKKSDEDMTKLHEAQVKAAESGGHLEAQMRKIAAIGAAELSPKIIEAKNNLADAEIALSRLKEKTADGSAALDGYSNSMIDIAPATKGSAQEIFAASVKVETLKQNIIDLNKEMRALTTASSGAKFTPIGVDTGTLASAQIQMDRSAKSAEAIGRALGNVGAASKDTAALMNQVASVAQRMGGSMVEAAAKVNEIGTSQFNALINAAGQAASVIGNTLGNVMMNVKGAWNEGLKSMIGLVFDTATQVVMMSAIMNEAITAALIPGSFIAILGLVVALQAIKAVAMASLSKGNVAAAGAGAAASAGVSMTSSASGAGSSAGPGGTAVATAQREVQNNIVVNLPVQALDLAAISDIQLKNFANRIGRVIREAAATGQFSTVGA